MIIGRSNIFINFSFQRTACDVRDIDHKRAVAEPLYMLFKLLF